MKRLSHSMVMTALFLVITLPGVATGGDGGIVDAVERVYPSIVMISSSGTVFDDETGTLHSFESVGSGFAIGEGLVVTNHHVIADASRIEVVLHDRLSARAAVVGTAPSYDLALLHVPFGADELPPIDTQMPPDIRVGQSAYAISNPLGLQHSVSAGIISGVGREFPGLDFGPRLIQFDVPINPGQSGGPLLNADGQVLGMTTMKLLDAEAIGFAIPFDLVLDTIPDLQSMGHPFRPELGFAGISVDADLATLFSLPVRRGVLIEAVEPESPAEAAGLQAGHRIVALHGRDYVIGGDIIISVDGRPVRRTGDLVEHFVGARPGQTVRFEVWRDQGSVELSVVIPPMKH